MKDEQAFVINNPFKQLSKQKYPPVATAKALPVSAVFKFLDFFLGIALRGNQIKPVRRYTFKG